MTFPFMQNVLQYDISGAAGRATMFVLSTDQTEQTGTERSEF